MEYSKSVSSELIEANVHQSHSQNDSGDLRGVAGGDGVCVVRQALVICVKAPPIHLGAWSIVF